MKKSLFLTNKQPLSRTLKARAQHHLGGLVFPESLSGMKLSFLNNEPHLGAEYDPIPLIPTEFWRTRIIFNIPTNSFYRKRLMREIFDMHHLDICKESSFHVRYKESCVCKYCDDHAHAYHIQYCTNIR